MKITAVVPAFQHNPNFPSMVGSRRGDAVDEFIAALEKATGTDIAIVEGSLDVAPSDGFVLLFESTGLDVHPEVARRAILINADRSHVLRHLEDHHLVAAVEKHRYFQWRTHREDERGTGVFGRKDVAAFFDSRATPGPFTTAHYVLLSSDTCPDLPSLLGVYLRAHLQAY